MGRAAKGVARYANFFKTQGALKVLDYGTGTMRNALYLAERGFTVYGADLPAQIATIRNDSRALSLAGLMDTDELARQHLNVDLVLSTYVFNIITASREQQRYLQNTIANLRPGGYLLFEARCRQAQTICGPGCSHFFKCSSCVKTYTHEELDALFAPYGLKRRCHYYRHQSLVAIFQLDRPASIEEPHAATA